MVRVHGSWVILSRKYTNYPWPERALGREVACWRQRKKNSGSHRPPRGNISHGRNGLGWNCARMRIYVRVYVYACGSRFEYL